MDNKRIIEIIKIKIPFCTALVNLSLKPLSYAVLRNSNPDI